MAYESESNKVHIRNYINPADGEFGFGTNTLFKYYERKVYGLKKCWKEETELAIQNQQLYLQFNDATFYPDPLPIDKGVLGYFISFTINMDNYQGQKIDYVESTYHDIDSFIDGRHLTVRRYEARVKGLMTPNPIPMCAAQTYITKLVNRNPKVLKCIVVDNNGNRVLIQGTLFRGRELYVYGQKDAGEPFDSFEKVPKVDLTHQKSKLSRDASRAPYIKDYVDPKDGKLEYSNNTVYRYFERQVHGLTGSWEEGTEDAITNGNLFLNLNGRKIFPDRRRINRGIRGYYVSFTIDIDKEQARNITYNLITKSNVDQYQYEAVAEGLWTPNPIPKIFIRNYLSKLTTLNISGIGYMIAPSAKSIKIKNIESLADNLMSTVTKKLI
ncbi:uncharacterized protein TRIADDRAFT_57186 [Trichoplax adhaerens]|uniref:Uncharacterized protein n=1 Tax=Trichoplax adhaerens TaxID=10228 RepID=B3S0V8_TRIAD|nr:predicted protein [Trichoplax adhaerens]EDV23713.1 predicted protein [Trichoplax adhaerens]|eukprot:XP_002113239.1 predicted protein [Trichoplax adhaerens]